MEWTEMTPDQRNELIHVKVMGKSLTCNEPLAIRSISNPDRSGGVAFVYCIATCSVCGYLHTGEMPTINTHPNNEKVPPYTTSMDAAWQVIRHISQPNLRVGFAQRPAISRFRQWFDRSHLWSMTSKEAAEVICLAALQACGVEVESAAETP